jgi:polyphosphate kinase 2 (PPK2 family)
VHELAPKSVWEKRYDHINRFEKMLVDEGTTILKFFLHISPEEQKKRLQARLDDKTKNWKFNVDDLKERKYWEDYMKAYEDVLSKTSTPWAPWYVIPANRKWYRNLVLSEILVTALQKLHPEYPTAQFDPKSVVVE